MQDYIQIAQLDSNPDAVEVRMTGAASAPNNHEGFEIGDGYFKLKAVQANMPPEVPIFYMFRDAFEELIREGAAYLGLTISAQGQPMPVALGTQLEGEPEVPKSN